MIARRRVAGALAAWPAMVIAAGPSVAATSQVRAPRAPASAAAAPVPASAPSPGEPHDPFGPVRPPEAPPAVALTTHLGRQSGLGALLAGRVTALQLMFTGCSATCPIQGAIFAASSQGLAGGLPDAQWLSVSVDPLGDDAPALARWLARFGGGPRWLAARPRPEDLDRLLDFLRGWAKGPDRHVGQAFLFDRAGRLVFRTADMPAPAHLNQLLREVAQLR